MGKKEKKEKKANPSKIGVGKLFLWNSRMVSISVMTLAISGYMLLYCTSVLGLSATAVSLMLMAGKLLDGVTDSIAGLIVDKTKTRWGKGRPYEVFIVLAWLCTWAMYSTPTGLSTMMKYVWVFVMYSLANSVCYTMLSANQLPYMTRAFTSEQIVPLNSYGGVITMLGAAIFNIFGPSLFEAALVDAGSCSRLVGCLAIAMAVIGILRMVTIPETIDVDSAATVKSDQVSIKDLLFLFKNNKYVVTLFTLYLVYNFVTAFGVGTYYYTYVVGSLSLAGVASAAQMLAIPLCLIFPQLLKKMNIAKLMMLGFFISAFGYLLNFFAGTNIVLLGIAAIFWGAGTIPASMMINIAFIECADFNEWNNQPRMEGSMSSLNGLMAKVGNAVGTGLMGIILDVAGITAASEAITAGTLEVMGAPQQFVLKMMFSLIPAVLYILVGLILARYDLGKKLPQIRADLAERRAAMAAQNGEQQ